MKLKKLLKVEYGLGDGVDASPYGMPSQFENNVIRRNVEL